MADNYLITGYWGEPHVTAENDRGIHAAIFGTGRFVLPVGGQLKAEYIGNNTVRIFDGKLIDNGAAAGIPAGEYVDLLIANAGQGKKRNDLIVFQYQRDASTLVERGSFVVVQGTETSGTASDPALRQENLLSGSAAFDQMALWRIPVSGGVISAPVQLFAMSADLNHKAPSGFGLGESTNATPAGGDANKIVALGHYQCNVNCPTDDVWYVTPNIHIPGSYEQHTAIRAFDGVECRRLKVGGSWLPWEWVNPPMEYGVEYRTVEQVDGQPVYTMCVEIEAFANGETETAPVAGATCVRKAVRIGTAVAPIMAGGAFSADIAVRCRTDAIEFTCNGVDGACEGEYATVQIWYVK